MLINKSLNKNWYNPNNTLIMNFDINSKYAQFLFRYDDAITKIKCKRNHPPGQIRGLEYPGPKCVNDLSVLMLNS